MSPSLASRGAGTLLCASLRAIALAGLLPAAAAAAEIRATPADYRAAVRALRAGDTLTLAPGTYRDGLQVHALVGSAARPIVIRGPRTGLPARFIARAGAHTVSIVDSAHVVVRDLELDGNGLPVAAVRGEGHAAWAHHITLENLVIRGHGAHQNTVGISSFCPSWGWTIRGNLIVGAGTGIYLGQSDGSAPFVGGLIEHNRILDTLGYNMQIKHQVAGKRVAGMPDAPAATIIRHNLFSKARGAAGGEMARPNLLVGHWPPQGPGAEDLYLIYGNLFYQNPVEALFQGEGNIALHANLLVNTFGDAINIRPHNALPRRIDVLRNTVLAANRGISVSGGDPGHAQRVYANAVFAALPISGGAQQGNVSGPLAEAAAHLADPFAPPGELDLSPLPGRLATEPIDPGALRLPELVRDFDGRIYLRPIAGAYAREGPARPLRLEVNR